jgi:hypothetical protein
MGRHSVHSPIAGFGVLSHCCSPGIRKPILPPSDDTRTALRCAVILAGHI